MYKKTYKISLAHNEYRDQPEHWSLLSIWSSTEGRTDWLHNVQAAKSPALPGPAEIHSPALYNSKFQRGIFNWFRCYHTRCDNRHRILSRWFQLDYWFFELANQTQRYINFEYRKINNHCFSSKWIFYFFLPFENSIIKAISYEIIQNNQ